MVINFVLYVTIGHKKCREVWPSDPFQYEKFFNIFLDMILLVLPLVVLGAAYCLISRTLWQSMDSEKQLVKQTSGTVFFTGYCQINVNSVSPTLVQLNNIFFISDYRNNPSEMSSSRKRRKMNEGASFHKLRNSSQEHMLLNRDVSRKHTFGLRR